jgi:translocation and assembly module TamA
MPWIRTPTNWAEIPGLQPYKAVFCCLLCVMFAWKASAADPQPYQVTIEPSLSSDIDAVLRSSSLLFTLRDTAPVPPFGLITRATDDVQRLTNALDSFGYYQSMISILIEGRRIDDPDLPAALDRVPQGTAVNVRVRVEQGRLYHLSRITVDGRVPREAQEALGLAPGDPAIAANVAAARDRLLTALQEDGYALATVSEPIAFADDQAATLEIQFRVNAGPQLDIGAIAFEGLRTVNEAYARDALSVRAGDRYRPSRIETARRDLLKSGVFSTVTVRVADQASSDGRIPLTFIVEERPLHAVSLSGAYSTDLGVSISATWTHRNLFGNAEQLILSAAGTGLWGNATDDLGYQLSAHFIKPTFLRRDQVWEVAANAVKQDLRAYKQRAESLGTTLRREVSPQWTVSLGLAVTRDDVAQKSVNRIYQLLAFPANVTYDSTGITNPLLDPTKGARASLILTPTKAFGARSLTFGVWQAAASAYFDLSGNGRSVLALRGLMGSVVGGASTFEIPPDQRLYAGGSATVRGFRYQSIGPLFPDGDPIGGTAVDAASIELRQRLFGDFGLVAFVDAGQASDEGVPFTGTLRFGAGTGLRYYTPIGVVRADVAVPINRAPGGDAFAIYIGLGQAF